MKLLIAASTCFLISQSSESFGADTYPSRPIVLVVPFAPGGSTDTIARIVAEGIQKQLGQQLVIENVSGADGTIGVGRAARAAPDGYTVGIGQWATHVLNGAAYSLRYDLVNDFEPVALLTTNPLLIVTNTSVPAQNLTELTVWLKGNPNKASVGQDLWFTGSGSIFKTSLTRPFSIFRIVARDRQSKT